MKKILIATIVGLSIQVSAVEAQSKLKSEAPLAMPQKADPPPPPAPPPPPPSAQAELSFPPTPPAPPVPPVPPEPPIPTKKRDKSAT